MVGNTCDLPPHIGQFGCVFGGNMICRLPDPMKFLKRLPDLLVPGGILVITSTYTWLVQYTKKVSCRDVSFTTYVDFQNGCMLYELYYILHGAINAVAIIVVYHLVLGEVDWRVHQGWEGSTWNQHPKEYLWTTL